MRHCDKCHIDFNGSLDRCPLCQAPLVGEATPSVFPKNVVKKSGTFALALLAFISATCLLMMIFFGYIFSLPGSIVLTVCLALAINYLFVRNILIHNPDFLRVVARYFLVLLALATVWFLATGNLAITTFVIPSICLVALVYDTVLLAIFRSSFVVGYAKYLLFDVVLGLIPLVLVVLGLTTWNILALISALVSSVFLLGLLIFMRKQLIEELRKLFLA